MPPAFIERLFRRKRERDVAGLLSMLHSINERESWALSLPDEDFAEATGQLRARLGGGAALDDLIPEAFALAREAARRKLGERAYDVQILGGLGLHLGQIVEMKTGEGKTLSSVGAAYLNSLTGRGVHIVTVNDYLAERDRDWMKPVFDLLGITTGVVLGGMDNERRREAYRQDITYGTNNEFGFDYLRDNMRFDIKNRVQRGHIYCIVDEIDSILIDEARTPLIISGPASDDTQRFRNVNKVIGRLVECAKDPATGDYPEEPEGDYKLDEKSRRVTFTDEGLDHLEELLKQRSIIGGSLFDDENFEYIHYATQALRAHHLYKLDVDYVTKNGQVEIVDEFTGRILSGRRYSEGLHQAIEAKEGIKIARRNRTLATITLQNYFRMYDKISGMTGTAETEAKEFGKIYGLEVLVVPTNRPVARLDQDDVIYLNENDKYGSICDEITRLQQKGQPVLVGTASINRSEQLSEMLTRRGVRHEVLNAKNHAREALIIAEAGAKGSVTIATNMAGRGTDIKLGGNPEFRARRKVGTEATDDEYAEALKKEYSTWREQYQEVRSLGGLYVLGTERHESRRIDNQLRGRSGRQGDPGESRFFLSMDDDLMRLFGGGRANLKNMMARAGLTEGEPLNHPLINRSIEKAQSKVEERNFDVRKHLLEYDDVVNEQRKYIYEQRDAILADADLLNRVHATAEEVVDEAFAPLEKAKGRDPSLVKAGLQHIEERLFFRPSTSSEELEALDVSDIKRVLLEQMRRDIEEKAGLVGRELFNLYIRQEYVVNIDHRWQDHLESLEALREAVYLRSYAQKNPLLEYKLEGFRIFDELIEQIRFAVGRKFFRIKVEGIRTPGERATAPQQTQEVHNDFQAIQPAGGPGGGASGAGAPGGDMRGGPLPGGKPVTIVRTAPKVGRNDPCPCGSGKKYKHCCGRGM